MTVHDVARALPDIETLRRRCRGFAMLDAIIDPVSGEPFHDYDAHWAPGQEVAFMRNGSGDEYSVVFAEAGAFIRAFDHESPMSPYGRDDRDLWPGVVDDVPDIFAEQVAEPAFQFDGVLGATACLWRQNRDDRWHTGVIDFPDGHDPDGTGWMFQVLADGSAEAYQSFAEDYYETELDVDAVAAILAGRELTAELVRALNPAASFTGLVEAARRIGYQVRPTL